MKLYLSGPMSGIPEWNFPEFNRIAKLLRSHGYDIVNPAENVHNVGKEWHECLRYDIVQLVGCDGIALMAGWHKSRGARLEFEIAERLGMVIHTVEELL